MEQLGFFGAIDKKDLLLNVSKILTTLGKRVLIVDATYLQRMRYLIPKVGDGKSVTYISEYAGIDVAVGFVNLPTIMQYLNTNTMPYDYMLIDTDNIQTFNSYGLAFMKKLFFVTSYDRYEVNKAKEVLANIKQPLNLKKIVISSDNTKAQEDFLKHEFEQLGNITFENLDIDFSDTNQDREFTLENQLTNSISFKHYTSAYKGTLEFLTALIAEGMADQQSIRRVINSKN